MSAGAGQAVRKAWFVWPAALLGGSLYLMAVDLLHMPNGRLRGQTWVGVDFHTYLAAAIVGLRHGWVDIYDQGMVEAAQQQLVPRQFSQPFLSPPADSWLALPLTAVPYGVALAIWTSVLLLAMALALAWTSSYRGPARIAAAAVAMTPWWVLLAVYVGQVVPLVAAAVLVAWRLVRSDRQVAAGLVLALLAFKPNTALLVPFALLVGGRWGLFAAWAGASVVVGSFNVVVVGPDGVSDYLGVLGDLPRGASALTLAGAFGLSGAAAVAVRIAVVVGSLVAAYALRARAGLAMAVGVLGSLLASPYLHNSDLCLLVAAGWMVWVEAPVWRAALVAMLVAASPLLLELNVGPNLEGWVRIELALLIGLLATALMTRRVGGPVIDSDALTAGAEFGRHAPA